MNILLIDDNKDIRLAMTYLLKREGINVIECESGTQGIELLKAGMNFDLVISDVQMPDGDGHFVMREMNALNLRIPLFLFSSVLNIRIVKTYPYFERVYGKLDYSSMLDRVMQMKEVKETI